MTEDDAKKLEKLEDENATLQARLEVLERQRNEALTNSVVREAAAKREMEGLVKKANAELKRLTEELKAAKEPKAAPKVLDAEVVEVAPPPAPNGHAMEACNQA
jgi:peptidoglycan hydrolase CwlO-like protein